MVDNTAFKMSALDMTWKVSWLEKNIEAGGWYNKFVFKKKLVCEYIEVYVSQWSVCSLPIGKKTLDGFSPNLQKHSMSS